MRSAAPFRAGALALLPALLAVPAAAWGRQVHQGETLALNNCARCHAVGRTGASPWPEAPLFRDLHTRYPVEDLGEALAEGIRTGHPSMPEFRFDPDQAEALIAYLKSLER
jgi:mono/diheme cytochrome c family protein